MLNLFNTGSTVISLSNTVQCTHTHKCKHKHTHPASSPRGRRPNRTEKSSSTRACTIRRVHTPYVCLFENCMHTQSQNIEENTHTHAHINLVHTRKRKGRQIMLLFAPQMLAWPPYQGLTFSFNAETRAKLLRRQQRNVQKTLTLSLTHSGRPKLFMFA